LKGLPLNREQNPVPHEPCHTTDPVIQDYGGIHTDLAMAYGISGCYIPGVPELRKVMLEAAKARDADALLRAYVALREILPLLPPRPLSVADLERWRSTLYP